MKKKFNNTMRLLSMAALAIVGTILSGCGNDDSPIDQQNARTVTLTTTISLGGDGSSQTRALDASGRKTFSKNDLIAVIYHNKDYKALKALCNPLTDDDISDGGKTAKITVTLSEPGGYGNLRLIYPAAMAKATIDEYAAFDDDAGTIDYSRLDTQDGTLETLANDYDLATYDGMLTSDAKLPTTKMTLTNRLAIGEFTIKNSVGTNITSSITNLTVSDDNNTYAVTPATSIGDGPIYVAMRPVASEQTITFSATDGTNQYIRSVRDKTLAANNMYPVNLTMAQKKTVSLTALSANYVAQDGDILTGTLNEDGTSQKYKISIAHGATVTLRNATINGVHTDDSNELWAGLTCEGDATIILEGTNAVQNFNRYYPGLQPGPENTTLTIRGSGSLTASGSHFGAGIGTKSEGGTCGNIRIEGGTVIANCGVMNAAGIGSSSGSTCGDITITGSAIVTANGGQGGAGIGSGVGMGSTSQCGNITISGSVQVTATGGMYGAGIGTGMCGKCGNIDISGGTIVATGVNSATGIGTGNGFSSPKVECGAISISKGEGFVSVTAIRDGASMSIGTNNGGNDNSYKCGRITFDGEEIFNGNDNGHYSVSGDRDYGNLHFVISTTTNDNDTWTLTPNN